MNLHRSRTRSRLEALEARIAPAILLNARTVQYTDENSDLVTVKISKGSFNGVVGSAPDMSDFVFGNLGAGEILQRIELSDDSEFQNAKLTVTVAQARRAMAWPT